MSHEAWDIYKRGLKDALRHDKRLKDAIKKSLKDAIKTSEITIGRSGRKYVRIRSRSWISTVLFTPPNPLGKG